MKAALVALLAPTLLAADVGAPILLRYRFAPGQTLRYRAELRQSLRIHNARGQLGNLDLKTEYALDLAQRVVGIGPGPSYEIEATTEGASVKLEGPMAKSSEQIAETLRKVGFTLTLDAQGRVTSLAERKGTPAALKKLTAGLKNALATLLPMLPDAPQRPGGAWRQELRLPIDLPTGAKLDARLTVDYQLRGYANVARRPCADLGMRLYVGIAGALGQASNRVMVTGQGGGQGYAYLDLEQGVIVATGVTLWMASHYRSQAVEVRQESETRSAMLLKP